jgi:DNA-binding transcriptional LysR family regulator
MNARLANPARLVRRIDLVTLQLFMALCEEGNLTRAAARQAIAPSAASKRLSGLEQALGVLLVERRQRGMTTTHAGEALLHYAKVILQNAEKASVELAEYSHGVRGHVRMLANLSAIIGFLPEDLPDFFRAHGLLRLDLQEKSSEMVVQGVKDGAADIGICSDEAGTHGLQSFPYRRDRLVVVVPRDHPIAGRHSVRFVETLDFDYVALHSATSIHLRLQTAAKEAGRAIRWRVHVPGFDAICRMVQAGVGLSVIPDRIFDVLSHGMGLLSIPLLEHWAKRQLALVVRDQESLSIANHLMLDHLRGAEERHNAAEVATPW